jgi:predicted glycoside hydrolase/deacetylase ChbG (UPF0249 family)
VSPGLLIVTADDFGYSRTVTKAIRNAHAGGGVSTTSAMTFMRDTESAADSPPEGLRIGLHMNLSMRYEAANVPRSVGERQLRMTELFGRTSWQDGSPKLGRRDRMTLADVIADQTERFHVLFGEPDHVNGHHHVHLHPSVLELLPASIPTRPRPTSPSRLDRPPGRSERSFNARFVSAAAAVDFRRVHPALGGVGLDFLEHADRLSLEVFCHPREDDEFDALGSPTWAEALARMRVGSYADLREIGQGPTRRGLFRA